MSKKYEKSLEEYENIFPQKYYLSLFDESSDHEGQIDLSKTEDVDDPNNIPLKYNIHKRTWNYSTYWHWNRVI